MPVGISFFTFQGIGYVVDVAWSPDGARLATAIAAPARECSAKIYDVLIGGEVVRKLPARQHGDRCLAWSDNGRLLATAGLVGDGQATWQVRGRDCFGSVRRPGTSPSSAGSQSPQ